MSKVETHEYNPIDNFFIDLSRRLSPSFKKAGFTPNGITTLSLVFSMISIYFLLNYNMSLFIVSYLISYFFDCMDGYFARRYNMVSKIGDMYDHFKDITFHILLFLVIVYHYPVKREILITSMSILFLAFILTLINMGCEEKIHDGDNSGTIHFTRYLCIGNPKNKIQYTKYFGTGTFIIIVILNIIYINQNRLNK